MVQPSSSLMVITGVSRVRRELRLFMPELLFVHTDQLIYLSTSPQLVMDEVMETTQITRGQPVWGDMQRWLSLFDGQLHQQRITVIIFRGPSTKVKMPYCNCLCLYSLFIFVTFLNGKRVKELLNIVCITFGIILQYVLQIGIEGRC